MLDIQKGKQRVHIRKKGKSDFPAGTNMNADKLLKLLTTTIRLVQHYLKKRALKEKE